MSYRELITGTGERLGIRGMFPDDAGDVTISDESTTVVIGHDEAQDRVTVRALVGPVPEGCGAGLYRMLLGVNLHSEETKGASLAVDADSGSIFLCRSDRVEGLSVEVFAGLLQDFVNDLARFRADIEAFARLAEEPDERPDEFPSGQGIIRG